MVSGAQRTERRTRGLVKGLAGALLAALVATVALPARGDIYMSRGADGTLHFTNVPGERRPGSTVVVRSRDSAARPPPAGASASQVISAVGDPAAPLPSFNSAVVRSLYDATSRDPARYERFDAHVREAAALYQIPESLVRAVIRQESDFNPYSVSHSGAMGLMQLMPQTAASMSVRDPFDPRQCILGGTRFLRLLANMFNGDLVLTIAAYNAGPNAVIRHAGVPPYEETQHYVQQVLRYYYTYRSGEGPGAGVASVAPAAVVAPAR